MAGEVDPGMGTSLHCAILKTMTKIQGGDDDGSPVRVMHVDGNLVRMDTFPYSVIRAKPLWARKSVRSLVRGFHFSERFFSKRGDTTLLPCHSDGRECRIPGSQRSTG